VKRPLPADAIPEQRLRELRLLASDIDDTLTRDGVIDTEIFNHLARLRRGGVAVWLVTGRCAAWGQALAHYLDVDGVIAENGGVVCVDEDIRIVADAELIGSERVRLREAFEKICAQVPAAQVTQDNIGRLTDWTFVRPSLSDRDMAVAADIAREAGLRMIASSIHVHLFAGAHTKATALAVVCDEAGVVNREQVLTLGDSPNDEPLFDESAFPFSVGVANLAPYLEQLDHKPLFLLPHPEAEGALWLLKRILVTQGL